MSVANSSGIRGLTYCPFRAILVVICGDLALHAYRSALDGSLQEMRHVKLDNQHGMGGASMLDFGHGRWDIENLKKTSLTRQ